MPPLNTPNTPNRRGLAAGRGRPARRLLWAALLLALPVHAGTLVLAPGDSAPTLRGTTTEGKRALIDFGENQFTLVNFWATWCEPCKGQMPTLQQLADAHLDDDLRVVGVLFDTATDEAVNAFADALGVKYTLVRPRAGIVNSWGGVGALPTSYLIDRDGVIRRRYVGATAEQIEGLVADVRSALAGEPLAPLVVPDEPNAVTSRDRKPGR